MHDLTDSLSVLSRGEGDEEQIPEGMSPKVVEVYKSLGKIMSRYSTGKVPKAFKIIPNLKQWEEVSAPTDCLHLNILLSIPGIVFCKRAEERETRWHWRPVRRVHSPFTGLLLISMSRKGFLLHEHN